MFINNKYIIIFSFFYLVVFPFLIRLYTVSQVKKSIINKSNTELKTGVLIHNKEKSYSGVTMFTLFGGYVNEDGSKSNSLLIDENGKVINKWKIFGWPAQLFPGGYVLGTDKSCNSSVEDSHQEGCSVMKLDWEGNVLWEFNKWELDKNNNYISRSHHDIQQNNYPAIYTPQEYPIASTSEKILILSHKNVLNENINPQPLEDDVLLEINKDGEILWKWIASEHFNEFGFTNSMKEAIFNVKLIKSEFLAKNGYPNKFIDWLHINSASYLGSNLWYDNGDERFNPENIMISSRNGCFVAIINKETGKIVWQIGPDYSNESEKIIGQIIGQHDVYIIPKGLPGEGNIIMFDNGGFSCYGTILGRPTFPANFRDYSRIVEINPITLKIVWEYLQLKSTDNTKKFFSWAMGSVQRLPNGNTLISEAMTRRIFEVTQNKEIVWEYIAPLPDNNLFLGDFIYNAYRYPEEWLPKED